MPAPRIRDTETGLKLLEVRRQAFDEAVERLARQLGRGDISLVEWRSAMRREIRDLHRTALIVARGGEWDGITLSDWGRLGGHLRVQYRYLDRYARAIREHSEAAWLGEGKPYSEPYLVWRGKLYGYNARASYWRGVVYGLLPQVPGDGQTMCKTGCQCRLRIEDGDEPGVLLVYWELGAAEHCPDCLQLAAEWSPYVLELPPEAAAAAVARGLTPSGFVTLLLSEPGVFPAKYSGEGAIRRSWC
jgi:hypothetical protein